MSENTNTQSPDIDWNKIGFGYIRTDYNVRCYHKNGKWGEIEVSSDENISMNIAATCLHYGQESFEGLKAYRGKDGKTYAEHLKRYSYARDAYRFVYQDDRDGCKT